MNIEIVFAIIAALLAVSEALSFIPGLKSNGIFQLIYNVIKTLDSGVIKRGE